MVESIIETLPYTFKAKYMKRVPADTAMIQYYLKRIWLEEEAKKMKAKIQDAEIVKVIPVNLQDQNKGV